VSGNAKPPGGTPSPFGHMNIRGGGGPNTYTAPAKRPHQRDNLLEIHYFT
jgi:hypothetical protein